MATESAGGGGGLRISGTNDWTRTRTVLDVPPDATRIEFGVGLWGPGRVFFDEFVLQSVPLTLPTTSHSDWHLATEWPSRYRLSSDPSEPCNGYATARLTSAAATLEDQGKWVELFRREDQPSELIALRGKRVRISAMIKSEGVARRGGVVAGTGHFDAKGRYAEVSARADLPVRGSSGWLRYAVTLDVPQNATRLQYGVRLEGPGTL